MGLPMKTLVQCFVLSFPAAFLYRHVLVPVIQHAKANAPSDTHEAVVWAIKWVGLPDTTLQSWLKKVPLVHGNMRALGVFTDSCAPRLSVRSPVSLTRPARDGALLARRVQPVGARGRLSRIYGPA